MAQRQRPIRSASVLMPTYQGAEFLDRVLTSLAGQRWDRPWDVLVVDSGSTDGTLEILGRFADRFPVPMRVRSIHKTEFDHGDTRNLLAALSDGDLLVFLTQDAIPAGSDWLAGLARNFEDAGVGGAYCRNVARPDASAATKLLCVHDPGYSAERRVTRLPADHELLDPHQRRLLYNFNDVASAVPRELWERHPFPRTWFGEDVLQARALLEAGFAIAYDADAVVEHSHDYTVQETRERARIDGRFNAEWLGRIAFARRRDVDVLADRLARDDPAQVAAAGHVGAEADELVVELDRLRRAAFLGQWEGGRTDVRRPSTRLLGGPHLHVLFVVHGFPPDTWAGTEIYTLELAKALQARGHRCTVFARAPAEVPEDRGGPQEYSVIEDELQGLRVLRFVHRLEHRNLRESYEKREPEQAFRRVLFELRPDVVHFQHLIHTSVGLVDEAKALGLPTIVHCHDYWAICPRVQLIRPDGERCEKGRGAGCLLCVKEQKLDKIPRLELLGQLAGPRFAEQVAGKLARSPVGSRFRRRFEGLEDLLARGRRVLEVYAAADLLISPSRFLRDKLLETGAFDPHRFLFSDNGLRTDHVEALEKQPDPEGRVRFGFVGSIVWYKGVDVLLRAMSELANRPVELHVYGGFDPERDEHHAELQRLAGPNVTFHGRFDNARLSEVYAKIDVLVVPSVWWENSPITIHEAYLTHTPVVASDIGGMAEYVRDGVDGMHFRAGDPGDLARVLARFVEMPDLRERLSRDWMRVKTAAENAAETEFRYRGLVAQARERGGLCLLEGASELAHTASGPVERQGADLLLLRPGARVQFEVRSPFPEPIEAVLELRLMTLGGEAGVRMVGEVALDGRTVGRVGELAASDRDQSHVLRFRLSVPPGGSRLELVTRDDHLRVERIALRESREGALAG